MSEQGYLNLKVFILVAAWMALLSVVAPGFLARVESLLSDRLLVQHARGNRPDERLIIVDIDDYSIEVMSEQAGRWPWPRSLHAELIEMLHAAGARVLVFDILFSEADLYRPEDDAYFSEAVARTSAWLPSLLLNVRDHGKGTRIAPLTEALGATPGPPAVAEARAVLLLPRAVETSAWRTGLINSAPDHDGVTRRYPLWQDRQGWKLPSLATRVAGSLGAVLPGQREIVLGWQGDDPYGYPSLPYADVFAGLLANDAQLAGRFRDRIVLIGASAAGLHDIEVTPVSTVHLGTQVVATAIDNLLNREYLVEAPAYVQVLVGLGMIIVFAGVSSRVRSVWRVFGAALALSLVVVGGSYAMLNQGWLVPVALALLSAWTFLFLVESLNYGRERLQRKRAFALLGRFLDPVVVGTLSSTETVEAAIEPRNCEITVLFADIRNFTEFSEAHPPEVVMAILNAYYRRQIEVIFRHRGTLDKFIGDTLMAFWGAPVDNPDHAATAVRAALDMSAELDDFRREGWFAELDIGIGLHTGTAMVGMIGSRQRYDYTVIGDTVNLASRIEGQTKDRARILVSGATHAACAERFRFRDHGSVHVKGREEEVHLYEPIAKS